jgi:hypothetical protein
VGRGDAWATARLHQPIWNWFCSRIRALPRFRERTPRLPEKRPSVQSSRSDPPAPPSSAARSRKLPLPSLRNSSPKTGASLYPLVPSVGTELPTVSKKISDQPGCGSVRPPVGSGSPTQAAPPENAPLPLNPMKWGSKSHAVPKNSAGREKICQGAPGNGFAPPSLNPKKEGPMGQPREEKLEPLPIKAIERTRIRALREKRWISHAGSVGDDG